MDIINNSAPDLPRRRGGRPPKYDWADKRDVCYKLYVEEDKSASDITRYFADHFHVDQSVLPCRKGFLRQFQIWGFPSKSHKLTAEEEPVVLNRIRELWEQNVNQKDIKSTLADEGFELKDYEFTKLWKKMGLRLRNNKGYKIPDTQQKKRKRSSVDHEDTHLPDLNAQSGEKVAVVEDNEEDHDTAVIAAPMDPEKAARRAQRLQEIQAESDQRLESKKRRRRIRGYGHLPPDAAGTAPRYNSETSLDECKAYLHLSNEMYQIVRKNYEVICREMGIIKKTQCAEGDWEESKRRLVRGNMHLSAVMHPLQPDLEKKNIAMDCLCADVTKRMRVAGKAITIAEANNLLGLNPTESTTVRRAFYELLAADNFESRLVCGEDHWRDLRKRWFEANEKVQEAVSGNDPKRMKAVDLLCSDATKRFREDKNKRGERVIVQKNAKYGPGPGPAWAATAPRSKTGTEEKAARKSTTPATRIREPHVRDAVAYLGDNPMQENGDLITTLAQATGNVDFDLDPALSAPGPFLAQSEPPVTTHPITAYFRLASSSRLVGQHPRMWLGKLASASISAVHKAATSKAEAATVSKINGIVKNADGTEDSWLIESEDELSAYLQEAREKATFVVVLQTD